ncbi:hypothetical protein BX616_001888 [Lobosporangium transversale]|nr:hypothetical protein BX616_001888 [Lobosporangium transversale]
MSEVIIDRMPSNFLNDDTDKSSFPNVTRLSFVDVKILDSEHYTQSYCLGMLARRCPGLRSLYFNDIIEKSRFKRQTHIDFYKSAFLRRPYALTSVSDLCLPTLGIEDGDMAALLSQMTELKRLDAPYCNFADEHKNLEDGLHHIDPYSVYDNLNYHSRGADDIFQYIRYRLPRNKNPLFVLLNSSSILHIQKRRDRRLCDTIEVLRLYHYSEEADGTVQAILSNCPRLKELIGSKITVTEIVKGVEWVSTNLILLAIQLEADVERCTLEGMEKQRIVFRQLGRLTRLQKLALTGAYTYYYDNGTLDLTLRAGLDELVNLKQLSEFPNDRRQFMEYGDATWIIYNWPSISELNGLVNCEDSKDEVADLLRSHHIALSDSSYQKE